VIQIEGTAVGIIIAAAIGWLIAVILRRDWQRLAIAVVVSLGSIALTHLLGLIDFKNIGQRAHLDVIQTTLLGIGLPALAIRIYKKLLPHSSLSVTCKVCGEKDNPPHARYCSSCGAVLGEAKGSSLREA
jgi:hypothetical protein